MEITTGAQFYYQQNKTTSLSDSLARKKSSDAELKESCRDFEAIFIKQMLNTMKSTVHKSGFMGEVSKGEEIFEDMLYDEYAKKMADSAGFGIADQLYEELSLF